VQVQEAPAASTFAAWGCVPDPRDRARVVQHMRGRLLMEPTAMRRASNTGRRICYHTICGRHVCFERQARCPQCGGATHQAAHSVAVLHTSDAGMAVGVPVACMATGMPAWRQACLHGNRHAYGYRHARPMETGTPAPLAMQDTS